jgi:ribosomal protein L11 methyltransferase
MTRLPGEAAAGALGAAMEGLRPAPTGVGVFEIEDDSGLWEVGGYFTAAPDRAGLALLSSMYGAADFAVSKLDDRDWVAQVQRELHPVVAGRIFLHGPHDADRVPVNAVPLRIEAAMAFGTGHHGTTLGCLLALTRLQATGFRPDRVADIGCGTGVLAIAAAKLWRAACVAVDIDTIAERTARANMAVNGVQGLVRTGRAAGFRSPLARSGAPYDLVLANILAGPLKRLAPQTRAALRPGGIVVLSGILDRQLAGVLAVHAGHGFRREALLRIGGWSTVTLRLAA